MEAWAANPSTRFLEQVLDSCRDLIFVKNEKFQVLYANKAMIDFYPPHQRDKIVGYTTVESFSDEEARVFLAQDMNAFENGFSQAVEQLIDRGGRNITLDTKKTRFVDESGNVRLIGVATDISDLVEQTDRLTESNKTLQKFASFAAHDLASPLGSASLMLQNLQMNAGIRGDGASRDAIGEVVGVLQSSANNISSLLILQKALLGERLARQPTDLTEIANRAIANLTARTQAASGHIVIDALPTLDCHPILVETLFQNLIENSLKYRSGAAPIIRITSATHGSRNLIFVEDNGSGMDNDDRRRVFDLFVQGNSSDGGLGIGLSLCKGITDAHGGTIWIDTEYVGGTKVGFTLSRPSTGAGLLASRERRTVSSAAVVETAV